ncbi:MAG: hypothetical protein ACRDGF_08690 [Chloroflexota bacterium]
MHFDVGLDEAGTLEALRLAALAAYGAERATELDDALRDTARALHRVVSLPLDLTAEEPDFGG